MRLRRSVLVVMVGWGLWLLIKNLIGMFIEYMFRLFVVLIRLFFVVVRLSLLVNCGV